MINRLYAGLLAGLVMWAMAGCASAPKSTAESAAAPSTAAAAKTDASSYAAAPSTTARQTTTQRKQFKGTTDFPVSGEATKDKKFLTPLPDGRNWRRGCTERSVCPPSPTWHPGSPTKSGIP